MIQEEEANELMEKLVHLRNLSKKDKNKVQDFKTHEKLCIDKFKYIVTMRTSRYSKFTNYEDLNQDGFEALVRAMSTYELGKGSFFWWAHKYVDTKIARSANLHTTIRYPLKIAKENAPHKEPIMPILVETRKSFDPEQSAEQNNVSEIISEKLKQLPENQQEILTLTYGLNNVIPQPLKKIPEMLGISESEYSSNLRNGLKNLKKKLRNQPIG